jgi:hypothetical protein
VPEQSIFFPVTVSVTVVVTVVDPEELFPVVEELPAEALPDINGIPPEIPPPTVFVFEEVVPDAVVVVVVVVLVQVTVDSISRPFVVSEPPLFTAACTNINPLSEFFVKP